jgi:repressor LexA
MSAQTSSDLQNKIYEYIVKHIRSEGMPPTIREIGSAVKIASTGHVDYHLTMLEKRGLIVREPKKSRGIKLVHLPWLIPIMGYIAAGEPLEIFTEPDEFLNIGPGLEYENTYALIVKGNSMIENYIYNGDYVIVKPQTVVENGDIVVAVHLQGNGRATLKRFFQEKERGRVRLQPANPKMDPIYVSWHEWDREWEVQGKVAAVFRKSSSPDLLSSQPARGEYNEQNTENFQGVLQGSNTPLVQIWRNQELLVNNLEQTRADSTKAPSTLSLLAIARVVLEQDDIALVGKVYVAKAGISQSKQEEFEGEPFEVSVPHLVARLSFDMILHKSENIELLSEWHKNLLYYPHNPEPQLVEFPFYLIASGSSYIAIDFYHERRWLRTIRLEFDAIEKPQLIALSSEV